MTQSATCPRCGRTFEFTDEAEVRGGKNRWKGTTKAQRSEAAKAAANARWAKERAKGKQKEKQK